MQPPPDTHPSGLAPTAAPPPASASAPAISVQHISKLYRIYDRPQDRLKQLLLGRFGRNYGREFWALRDVSLEVAPGEAVGIIGRNGSGKSTLLQIIAGTLTPTSGTVQVNGRVTALLELGSGFNPEFSGRENVFLNGAILGFEREQMAERLDDILAFADIGAFVDQPVKTYSSGMLVRLAFAVQAHLQPDVLIVDEALSVGDVYFQHKCMNRIKALIDQGCALLFVSHAPDTVKRFCNRGLWLDSGEARFFGEAGVAIQKYMAAVYMRNETELVAAPIELPETSPDAIPLDTLPLPGLEGVLDLDHPELFLRGRWEPARFANVPLAGRRCLDTQGLAGFRFTGSCLTLSFLREPQAGRVLVTIDGRPHLVEVALPNDQATEQVTFQVEPGQHTVLVQPAEGARAGFVWLGAQAITPGRLVFRRDPKLDEYDGPVERYGNGKARITAVELLDYLTEQPVTEAVLGQRLRVRIHAERLEPAGPRLEMAFVVRDKNRIDLFGTTTVDEEIRLDPAGRLFVVEFSFAVRLAPGSYSVLASFVECSNDLTKRVPMDQIDIALVFTVPVSPKRIIWFMYDEPVVTEAEVVM
ncbi:MAG: hypothetical protein OHK0022_57480 [Roseiflexaceae bacterium]